MLFEWMLRISVKHVMFLRVAILLRKMVLGNRDIVVVEEPQISITGDL